MSVWTHVAAVFRVDGLSDMDMYGPRINGYASPKWDEVTGKAIYECDWLTDDDYQRQKLDRSWAEYDERPELFMPVGSEGSLQRVVWVNPDRSCAARYTVTVFGDLRDYEDHEAIHEWFIGVCRKCNIRQAVCHCDVSGPTYVWEYTSEDSFSDWLEGKEEHEAEHDDA